MHQLPVIRETDSKPANAVKMIGVKLMMVPAEVSAVVLHAGADNDARDDQQQRMTDRAITL